MDICCYGYNTSIAKLMIEFEKSTISLTDNPLKLRKRKLISH